MQNFSLGLLVIRIGLAGVLLWFGSQQLLSPSDWVGYVPAWASMIGDVHTIVFLNGSLEILCGLLLLSGFFIHIAALFMALHLILIASSLGYNSTAIRDWGLAFSFLGLVFAGGGEYTLRMLTPVLSRTGSR